MQHPSRIVSLLSSGTEILFALGLGERVVAVSHECDFPEQARDRPQATQSLIDSSQNSSDIDSQVKELAASQSPLYRLDAALINKIRPQLILTQSQCEVCAVSHRDVLELVRTAEALRETEVLDLNPLSLHAVLDDILRIGMAAGARDAATNYVAALQKRIDRVVERSRAISTQRPRTICIEWTDPIMVAGNWTPELVSLAGGDPRLTTAGQPSAYRTWQQIVAEEPEVMILAPCGFDLQRSVQESARLTDAPGWDSIPAVQNGRVYAVDGNAYLNRSGPRLVESLEILAFLLHPQEFADLEASLPSGAFQRFPFAISKRGH